MEGWSGLQRWSWLCGQQGETERWSASRIAALFFFCFRAGIIGWAGWEGAAASVPGAALLHCWLDTPTTKLLYADAAPLFVAQGLFLSSRLSQTDILFFFFWTKHKRLFFGIPKLGIKAFCLRTNVLSPRGQRSVPAGGPSGTAGKVISERTSTGHLSCLFFYRDVCLVGSPSELIASKRALWTARSQFWWRLTPKMGPNRAVIVLVMPFASLANLASLCWGGASYAQLNKPLIIPRFENVASF